jgi:hypothetical protein
MTIATTFELLRNERGTVSMADAMGRALSEQTQYHVAFDACVIATSMLLQRTTPESTPEFPVSRDDAVRICQTLFERLNRFPEHSLL